MSDKLFKNDLTPSSCQSDGNFGQAVVASTVFLTLPSCALHNSLVPSPGEPLLCSERECSRKGCFSSIIPS